MQEAGHDFISRTMSRRARLLNWTQAELATSAGVSRSTIRDFEGERHQLHRSTEAQIVSTLEGAGVRLLPPDHEGPGVRLLLPNAHGLTGLVRHA